MRDEAIYIIPRLTRTPATTPPPRSLSLSLPSPPPLFPSPSWCACRETSIYPPTPPEWREGERKRDENRGRGDGGFCFASSTTMVKFSRELEAQLIPEWRDAFVDYRQLKKHVKKVKLSLSRTQLSDGRDHIHHRRPDDHFGFSILDPVRYVAGLVSGRRPPDHQPPSVQGDEEEQYELELVQSGEDEVKEFLDRLGEELDKVNNFYKSKEAEFVERGDLLNKQLQILLDFKHILTEHQRRRRRRDLASDNNPATAGLDYAPSARSPDVLSRLNSPLSESATEAVESPMESSVTDELIAAMERNGITFVPSGRGAKAKKGGKPKAASMRIDIPATTPTRTISAVTSMIWEDLVNNPRKEGGGGDYINRKKIQCAEKMIREAFVELYRGLGLLKTYSSLNMQAFTKILKKFDKVSKQQASASYLKVVKRSHFVSSDKVVRQADEVESIFTQHFASGDRKKAMKFLRPHQPKGSHMITFFVGLFTGSFVTLFSVYAILAHLTGIFASSNSSPDPEYVETVYPVFSMFALISLHIFLYGCNLLAWRSTRINYHFIFEFSPKTALRHRDAFLICTCIMTMVVGALVVQLIMLKGAVFSPHHANAIPGILLLLFTGLLICPFNIFYRSTRYSLLRVIRNIVFSPFYKVLMVDFFMADQLTSQIPLLRHMEFTVCYFMAGGFKTSPYDTCTRSQQYKLLAYVISFLPYYWRAMQCIRRYVEEGYDINHMANAGKYISAMVAAAARMKYAVEPTPLWLAVVVITSTMATCYQLYWDFVKDWGFFSQGSSNPCLRDDLILKNKGIYYVSIATNFVLRLAWVETVTHINLGKVEHRMVDFLLASLEIIRRGHWNYYRLENEHLNNVGKFRAVKTVPLPFREVESD